MSKKRRREPECWKWVVGYEGHYEISSYGRLRSVDRIGFHSRGGTIIYPGKLLAITKGKWGYMVYPLYDKTFKIHTLVCTAFNGPKPKGRFTVNHKDRVKTNNYYKNLEWMLLSDNISDSWKGNRTPVFGNKHGMSKLTEKDIPGIRKMLSRGYTLKEIASCYGVTYSSIWRIKWDHTWRRN